LSVHAPSVLPPLTEWESFYVIVGSSAGALTGLQFVVIAVGADLEATRDEETVSAFGTPTVVHFCAVLLIAAIVATPHHTNGSLSLCLSLCGLFGLAYVIWVVNKARRQTGYTAELEDWIWHAALPIIAYASLLIVGIATYSHPVGALYVVGATTLLLLFDGIHNAWDAVVWMSLRRGKRSG
jgi:hypothetical protein